MLAWVLLVFCGCYFLSTLLQLLAGVIFVLFSGLVLFCFAPWICASIALSSLVTNLVFRILMSSGGITLRLLSVIWKAHTSIIDMLQPLTLLVIERTKEFSAKYCISCDCFNDGFRGALEGFSSAVTMSAKIFGVSSEPIIVPLHAGNALSGQISAAIYLFIGSALAAAGLKAGWAAATAAGSLSLSILRTVVRALQSDPRGYHRPHLTCMNVEARPPSSSPHGSAPCCVVCHDAPVSAALRPCFHAGYCGRCADRLISRYMPCPMCRGVATGVQRIFLP